MIRAVLFDLDDTLADRAAAWDAWFHALVRRYPLQSSPDNVASFQIAARRLERRTQRCPAKFFAWLGVHCGLTTEVIQQIQADFPAELATFYQPRPEVNALIERLRSRYALAIVSNGSSASQRAKLARTGLAEQIECVIISAEVRATKPAPAIFWHALNKLGIAPEEALFVGDDSRCDIQGAAAIGMATCWVSRPAVQMKLAHTIADVTELESMLK